MMRIVCEGLLNVDWYELFEWFQAVLYTARREHWDIFTVTFMKDQEKLTR